MSGVGMEGGIGEDRITRTLERITQETAWKEHRAGLGA